MNKWSSAEIRQLRLRLGWSQAELARHLGCRQQTVSEWETDAYAPQNAYSKLLEQLKDQSQVHSDQIRRRPVAEAMMKQVGFSQITGDEVSERMPEEDSMTEPEQKFDPQLD
ncbi:MAG: helix-turn-helix domain-containing protein [Bdellovibrionia bacterium]